MSIKDLILGIDIGTTGTKCTFYRYDGSIKTSTYQEYKTISPEIGWAEQDPQRWWKAVQENLNKCFFEEKLDNSRIAIIGLSCTNAVTLVDDKGMPVYNAISLHDKRSSSQVAWLDEHIGEKKMLEKTGNRLDKGTFALPSLRWLIDNKPNILQSSKKLLMPSGYIIQKLTGVFSINESRLDLTSLGNIYKGEWDKELCNLAQIPERILPRVYKSTDIVGTISKQAAEATGLLEGTPVTAGAVDTVAATIGTGAVQVGDVSITLGSSGRICVVSDYPVQDKRLLNIKSAFPGQNIIVQSTDNAGISLKWFRDVFGAAIQKMPGMSIYESMDILAESVEAGANGITYLPYLTGEKSPIWDAKAKGVFFNVGIDANYGSFVRAILEGVAFSLRDCRDLVRRETNSTVCIPIGGGAASSRIWCQIFADILNCSVIQLQSNETETLGSMIIAAQAAGIKEIPFDFGKKLAKQGTILHPNTHNTPIYDEQFVVYKKLYERLKDCFY